MDVHGGLLLEELQKAIENYKENLTFGRDGLDFTWYKGSRRASHFFEVQRNSAESHPHIQAESYPGVQASTITEKYNLLINIRALKETNNCCFF